MLGTYLGQRHQVEFLSKKLMRKSMLPTLRLGVDKNEMAGAFYVESSRICLFSFNVKGLKYASRVCTSIISI